MCVSHSLDEVSYERFGSPLLTVVCRLVPTCYERYAMLWASKYTYICIYVGTYNAVHCGYRHLQ